MKNQESGALKPLLIVLAVVVVLGGGYLVWSNMGASAQENNIPGVGHNPDLPPITQEQIDNLQGPKPTGAGG